MALIAALSGLFTAAFVAATLVPFQSEILFVALQMAASAPLWALVTVASIGNTLGSLVNYAIGHGITRFQDRHWFPATPDQIDRASRWFQRWGLWTLLFSWAPVGDVVTLVAGVMRVPLWLFLLLVGISKTSRYIVLALITAQATGG